MSASACAEVAVDLIMAGSTESTKGLIFVNQSDTQPQRGGFRHSNKKSQQHWMQTEPSQQPDFTAINNYNCSSLFASVYFHRSVDTIMSETRGLWCYFASANLLWACNNFITPFYTWHKMCHFQKRVCKVISFSNSKLESLPLSPSPRPPDIFCSSLLAFFFSFTAPSLSTFLSSSFFTYFIRSFLLSIFAVFRISLLLSLFCSFCSFFLSPSFLTIFLLFLPLSDIFTLFLSSFLSSLASSFFLSHLYPLHASLPYCSPSLPSSLLLSFYLSVHSSYFFRLFFLPSFLLYVFLVDESLQVLCA